MNTHIRKLVYTALFAALTAVGAFLRIPMVYSSVTLQYLFTAMAGLLLGRRWGALSQAVYVLLGLVGLPIFTMGGGFGYVFQPTCGFLLGLIPAAWGVGAVAGESLDPKRMAVHQEFQQFLYAGELLLHLRRRYQRAQAVLAHHPGAAALRAAGTADPCSLYVRGLRVVPPDARRGRGVFFIGWISPTVQKTGG